VLQHHPYAITTGEGVQTSGLVTGKTALGKHEVALRKGQAIAGKIAADQGQGWHAAADALAGISETGLIKIPRPGARRNRSPLPGCSSSQ